MFNYFEFYINKKKDGGIKVGKKKKTLKKGSSLKSKEDIESGNADPDNEVKKKKTRFKIRGFKRKDK